MPDVDGVYNTNEEQERLAEIMETRYQAMAKAVNAAVIRVFGLDAERFRLRDSDVNLLLVDAAERVVRITETERMAIAEQLRLGQEVGLSNWEIANGKPEIGYRGVDGLYQETWRGRAETIARTELQHAQNEAALNRYMATGLVDKVQIVDGDDDQPCAVRNGRVVPISERPQLAHPNCLPAGQVVWAPNRQAGFARGFDGELVIVRTAADDLLTVTPNHPVLTGFGWARAGSLRKGDYVVRCADPKRVSSLIDPNHNHGPAPVEQIANPAGPPLQRATAAVPLSTEAFHGEATAGDVCVVWTNRRAQRRAGQARGNPAVGLRDAMSARLASGRALLKTSDRVTLTTSGGMGRRYLSGAPGFDALRLAEALALTAGAGPTPVAEPLTDRRLVDANLLGDLARADLLDDVEVIEVRRFPFQGHVYNLQTQQGWYIAENIVTHNCTLGLIPVLREGVA